MNIKFEDLKNLLEVVDIRVIPAEDGLHLAQIKTEDKYYISTIVNEEIKSIREANPREYIESEN